MLTKKHFLRFKWLVKRALSLPLGLLSETRGIRILAYHRVTDEVTNELAVSVATFLTQMEWLMKRHRVITLDEAVNLLLQDKTINESYTVLTFDDGYADFYDNVYPILSRLGLPATVFVPLGYVSTSRVFWWDKELGESNTLTLNQIRKMSETGLVDFQSHSIEHYDLDSVDEETLRREICDSKQLLGQLLGTEVKFFAYPRGLFTPRVLKLVRETYAAAVTLLIGINQAPADLTLLKRIPIERSDDLPLFKLKHDGKYQVLYGLRKLRILEWVWERLKRFSK